MQNQQELRNAFSIQATLSNEEINILATIIILLNTTKDKILNEHERK